MSHSAAPLALQVIRHADHDHAWLEQQMSLGQQRGLTVKKLVVSFLHDEFGDDYGHHSLDTIRFKLSDIVDDRLADVSEWCCFDLQRYRDPFAEPVLSEGSRLLGIQTEGDGSQIRRTKSLGILDGLQPAPWLPCLRVLRTGDEFVLRIQDEALPLVRLSYGSFEDEALTEAYAR